MAYKPRKRKVKKNIPEGCAHITSTFNNTITTFSDVEGNALAWSSSGAIGYKGSKKSTPFAAGNAAEAAAKKAYDLGMRKVEAAIRSIAGAGIEITAINDVTPIPHNGCRPPKRPRG